MCVKLKLLGSCDDEQCPYKHEGVIPLERYICLHALAVFYIIVSLIMVQLCL